MVIGPGAAGGPGPPASRWGSAYLARSRISTTRQRVLDAVLDLDDDGLVHLVADDVALARLAVVALVAHSALLLVLAHGRHSAFSDRPMLSSRSRISV